MAEDASRPGRRHASEARAREGTERAFGFVEDGLYVGVAGALAIVGIILFGYALYTFVTDLDQGPLTVVALDLLDNLLLVFIITEVIHTIRAVIDEKVLLAEPFLIVGIVAAIRRLLVVSAEAKNLLGKQPATFADAMLEIGVLTLTALLLTGAVFLLRRTTRSEPTPSHEPG
ncbi:MAG TPA: phosphate-starvation-inducible PsiE family protein [Actinomycetota bacterium]|nr:phosphate-starvation-inducible PsiE family protein [Actinomycetota bacterium]